MWLPRGKKVGEGWIGSLRLEDAKIIYKVDKQGHTVFTANCIQYVVINVKEF